MQAVEQAISAEGRTIALANLATDNGANVTKNVKATAGRLYGIQGDNNNAAARFLQLHDTATTPAGNAVPKLTFRVAATGSVEIGADFLTRNGILFTTGIAYAWSTTRDTYTAATAADHATQVIYK